MFTKLIFSVSRLSFGTLFSNSYLFPYFECLPMLYTRAGKSQEFQAYKVAVLHFYRAIHH